jgi:hypothetical protein
MGSVIKRTENQPPIAFSPQVGEGLLLPAHIFVTGPAVEVQGFAFDAAEEPTQADADRLATKFRSFYESLAPGERTIVTALLAQAADYVEQMWPDEYAKVTAG